MREEYQKNLARTAAAMTDYYAGDRARIAHFIKVHAYAAMIAQAENMSETDCYVTELAALVHDIGIKAALEKYGSSAGKYQEYEGPALAGELLEAVGVANDHASRAAWLVGRHHTYTNVEDKDLRVLLEADMLVNIDEEGWSEHAVESMCKNVLETQAGRKLFSQLYPEYTNKA